MEANSQLEWNTRVFDQKNSINRVYLREPVFNTQKLGYRLVKFLIILNNFALNSLLINEFNMNI